MFWFQSDQSNFVFDSNRILFKMCSVNVQLNAVCLMCDAMRCRGGVGLTHVDICHRSVLVFVATPVVAKQGLPPRHLNVLTYMCIDLCSDSLALPPMYSDLHTLAYALTYTLCHQCTDTL